MSQPSRPITIKDIAREADLSISAVSHALRGNAKVSVATGERVRAIAQQMGYRRNPAFAVLGSLSHRHPSSHAGLPIAHIRQGGRDGVDHKDEIIVEGMKQGCERMGYHLEQYVLDDFSSPEQFVRLIVNRGITGLIVGHLRDFSLLDCDGLDRVTLVAASRYRKEVPLHTLRGSRFEGARQTILNVHAAGYQKILVMQLWHAQGALEDDYSRYGGTMTAIRQIGEIPGGWVRMVDRPNEDSPKEWRQIIEKHQPDAVIGFSSWDYYQLLEAGFTNPETLGFAAEEINEYEIDGRVISGTSAQNEAMGISSIEWLDQLIRLGQFGVPKAPRFQGFNPHWLPGETLPLKTTEG